MRRRILIALALSLLAGGPDLSAVASAKAEGPPLRPARLAAQSKSGGIVFVGSSIFHRWTNLAAQMAPLPVTNVAIDGTVTGDMLAMLDSRILPLRPKVIAYYCGSNDVDLGEPADAIAGRIVQFIDRVNAALPATRIVYVSVNRAPEKQDLWNVVDDVNSRMQKYATTHPGVEYVDVNPVLFDAKGTPRYDLYMPDELHLRPPAYEGFAKILKPVLTQAFNAELAGDHATWPGQQ